jgi:hypothetical protein
MSKTSKHNFRKYAKNSKHHKLIKYQIRNCSDFNLWARKLSKMKNISLIIYQHIIGFALLGGEMPLPLRGSAIAPKIVVELFYLLLLWHLLILINYFIVCPFPQ